MFCFVISLQFSVYMYLEEMVFPCADVCVCIHSLLTNRSQNARLQITALSLRDYMGVL